MIKETSREPIKNPDFDTHFEAQYEKPEEIEHGEHGERLHIFDIHPDNEQGGATPVYFAQGWSSGAENPKGVVREIVRDGRRVVLTDSAWGIE